MCTHCHSIVHGFDSIASEATLSCQRLNNHYSDVWILSGSTSDANAVQVGNHQSGIVSAVASIIFSSCSVIHKIVTIHIIHEAIPVVIYTVASNLCRIHPYTVAQVFVVNVQSRVDEGDHCGPWPMLQCVELRPGSFKPYSSGTPLGSPQWIGNHRGTLHWEVDELVQLGKLQVVREILADSLQSCLGITGAIQVHHIDTNLCQMLPAQKPRELAEQLASQAPGATLKGGAGLSSWLEQKCVTWATFCTCQHTPAVITSSWQPAQACLDVFHQT